MLTEWACGVTTVKARVLNGMLLRTLRSLEAGGFPRPHLFVDGMSPGDWEESTGIEGQYDVTLRKSPVRTFGNWMLSALELFIRNPKAKWFAMFQDDCVVMKGLREYLELQPYPDKGYWNLYTFPENEKKIKGFYLSNQHGRGAVGLVFDAKALKTVLTAQHMINRPEDAEMGWRNVDGGIVTSMRKAGYSEYVHNPSLVQHFGEVSSMGNRRHPMANTFPGEDIDIRELMGSTTPLPRSVIAPNERRIGLIGYHCPTGLGEVNRQLSKYLGITSWLIKPHSRLGTLPPPAGIDVLVGKDESKVDRFLDRIDVLVFAETPYFSTLIPRAKAKGKRIICIPMIEWTPKQGWVKDVDLFICPTGQCYEQLKNEFPCVCFPWPFDTSRFAFQPRTRIEHFLFINGQGGWKGRKGAEVVKEAKRLWREFPLIVRSQRPSDWPPGTEVLPPTGDNSDLYAEGDALILPHSVDGIGLELLEAIATGMPVIATDGQPWNDYPLLGKIPARKESMVMQRKVDWYRPSAKGLVEVCQALHGRNITDTSLELRRFAEANRWQGRVGEFEELARTGFHRVALPFDPKEEVSHADSVSG